ncbi:PUA-like domain-containing protein [Lactarius quietus]|nr:PUA-like domain-containing protein [Lactarius quietus]
MATHLVPLFHCPVCPTPSPLIAPVTLFCGHSVCARHVLLPPRPPPLPVSSVCPLVPSPPAPSLLPTHRLLPASLPPPAVQLNRDAVAFAKIPDSRTDVTINKLASIVYRHDRLAQSAHTLDSGSGSDPESGDEEILHANTIRPSPSQPGARRKHLPPPRRLDSPAQSTDQFERELLEELSCEICSMLLYQPITTPCQHTFCSRCLYRSLDHRLQCPLCRQDLPGVMYFQEHPFNKTIISIILTAVPESYTERGRLIEQEERHARLDTPIFVCQLSFPGLPTILHFFEPRYRLMLRRCLEKPDPCFGMIMPPSPAGGRSTVHDFGTMLDIKGVRMLPDGRSIVETRGAYRFRIMERGSIDGYIVSRIERISDCPTLYPDLQELVGVCQAFLDQVQRGGAPWVVQRLNRLNHIYGPMPTDPTHFGYWMAMALPIEETEKAKLLPVKSPLLRLRLVVHWIEQLNSNWFVRHTSRARFLRENPDVLLRWFTNGCIVS